MQDLGWSCDSSIIVSVGLDSKVVVWSGHTFEKLKTITSHQSHVKGITFDPANKYFATASDDRSIKVFRFIPPGPNSTAHDQATNFTLERTITLPFMGSPLTTYFRRCSWSPDGAHLAGANAVNGPISTVAIMDRGTWDGDIHLVGHEAPVEVTAFCPRLWSSIPVTSTSHSGPGHVSQLMTVIACASQDKSISIWLTSSSRPIIINQDLASKSISDLAWSPDGYRLFATSLDGTILCLEFEGLDLGYCAPMEENEKALAKYGGNRKGIGLPESTDALLLEERAKEYEMKGVDARMGALMGEAESTAATASAASLNTPKDNATRSSTPVPNGTTTTTTNGDPPKSKETESTNGIRDVEGAIKPAPEAKQERFKARVTITKDGKKRMAPLLVSGAATVESSLPRTQLRAARADGMDSDAPQTILDLSKPYDGLPKGGLAALLLGNKRRYAAEEGDEEGGIEKRVDTGRRNGAILVLQNDNDGLIIPRNETATTVMVPEFVRPAVVNSSLSVSSLRLAVPKLRASITRAFDALGKAVALKNNLTDPNESGIDLILEVKNPTGPSPTGRYEDREPTRLQVQKKGQPVWQDFVPRIVLLIAGGSQFWAAACEDGSLYTWTPAGRRLTNTIVLEAQPVILESMDSWLLCVTAVGQCYVWNMETMSSPHPPVSLAPILDIATQNLASHASKAPSLTSARLSSEGKIVVSLSNGDGYSYNPSFFTWQRLSEVWWAVGSQYWNIAESSIRDVDTESKQAVSEGIVPFLEKSTSNEMLVRGRAYFTQRLIKTMVNKEGYEMLESALSIGHLETRLAAALMLGSKSDFQTYLHMYARRLAPEGMKIKAEELLRGLFGSQEQPDGYVNGKTDASGESDRYWHNSTDTLCGSLRKDLLRDVVLIFG